MPLYKDICTCTASLYLRGDSNWLAFIAEDDETEAKPVLGQGMIVLISGE